MSSLSTGNSVGKPVIRGLAGPRVLVLSDGVRQEEQQFGDDHPVNLDGAEIEKVEILRGPASVQYGSDAIGGVVNVIRSKAPYESEGAPILGGVVNVDTHSNDHGMAKNGAVFGTLGSVGYRVSAGNNRAGKYRTPDGSVRNTGFKEENAGASAGSEGAWGSWYIDGFHHEMTQDLTDNPNEDRVASPGARNTYDKVHLHNFLLLPYMKMGTDIGYQRSNRREIPDKNIYYPVSDTLMDPAVDDLEKAVTLYGVQNEPEHQGLNLFLDTTTLDVKFHHDPLFGLFKGTFGVSGINQRNSSVGEEQLIPAYHAWSVAAFGYEEMDLGPVKLSGGVRSEKRALDVSRNVDLGVDSQTRNFQSTVASVGAVWRVAQPFAIALNMGTGFRAPTPFELYANGVHEGTGKYETGNNMLKPEVSRDVDLSFRYYDPEFRAELTLFRNSIKNYIYSVNTGTIDEASSLEKYAYRQDPALIRGGEFSFETALLDRLTLQGGVDVVHGSIEKHYDPVNALNPDEEVQTKLLAELYIGGTTKPLPRMPADRARLGVKVHTDSFGPLDRPYFTIGGRFIAPQHRVDALETRTPGYSLLDLSAGFEVPDLGAENRPATFDVVVTNATNVKYIDALSRNRSFAEEPGVNVSFKLTMPFTLIDRSSFHEEKKAEPTTEEKSNETNS